MIPRTISAMARGRALTAALGGAFSLAAALALGGCGNSEAKNPPGAAPPPVPVTTAAVEERRLPGALDVTGALAADAQTEVAAEVAGRLVEVLVERGRVVGAGEVIARLDRRDAANQLREAEAAEAQTRERLGLIEGEAFDPLRMAEVREARITMERMEADHRRYERLVAQDIVARAEYDGKRADYLAQKARYEVALNQARQLYQAREAQRARVALMRKALEDTVVRAPFAGLVAERHRSVGQYLKEGDRIATLVRVDPLRVELSIPEAAVAAVRRGQRVSFAVQAYPGRTFEGVIAYVGPALRTDARALVVEAVVSNPGTVLQPGLFATARIELPAGAPTAFVPAAAVRTEAGVPRVFVVAGDRAQLRFVQIGRAHEGLAEILRGVAPGERVAVAGVERLSDGAVVAPADSGRAGEPARKEGL